MPGNGDGSLLRAATQADDAWSAEGSRVFRGSWGNVRYSDRARGAPGTELRRLYDYYLSTRTAWHAAGRPLGFCLVPAGPVGGADAATSR
jgi:hypothetical protein